MQAAAGDISTEQVALLSQRGRAMLFPSLASTLHNTPSAVFHCGFRFATAYIQLNASCLRCKVEASCRKHFVVVSREQQTMPLTSDEYHRLATVRRSCMYNTWRSHR